MLTRVLGAHPSSEAVTQYVLRESLSGQTTRILFQLDLQTDKAKLISGEREKVRQLRSGNT